MEALTRDRRDALGNLWLDGAAPDPGGASTCSCCGRTPGLERLGLLLERAELHELPRGDLRAMLDAVAG